MRPKEEIKEIKISRDYLMSETWKEAIIKIVMNKDGKEISVKDIQAKMESNPLVTDDHKKPWRANLQPRYHTFINSYLSALVKNGILDRGSRGMYSLKDKATSK